MDARTTAGGQLLRSERGATPEGRVRYVRLLPVGWDADVTKTRTTLANGVLTLVVPKTEATTAEKRHG